MSELFAEIKLQICQDGFGWLYSQPKLGLNEMILSNRRPSKKFSALQSRNDWSNTMHTALAFPSTKNPCFRLVQHRRTPLQDAKQVVKEKNNEIWWSGGADGWHALAVHGWFIWIWHDVAIQPTRRWNPCQRLCLITGAERRGHCRLSSHLFLTNSGFNFFKSL